MAEQMTLYDVLSDKPVPRETSQEAVVQVETKETPETPVVERPLSKKAIHRDKEQLAQGRVRDPETGQFAPVEKKEEVKEAEVKPEAKTEVKTEVKTEAKQEEKPLRQEMTDKEKALLKMGEEERRKRQELEREIAQMRSQSPKVEGEKKTFWDAPEETLAKFKEEVFGALHQTRLTTSDNLGRSRHQDYDEKVEIFKELCQQTPHLWQQAVNAPDPGEFAYKTGKSHKELQDAGDIDSFKEKIEKETRVRVETEMREKLKKEEESRKKEQEALPGSLSKVTGVGNSRPAWGGPPTLEDILKG